MYKILPKLSRLSLTIFFGLLLSFIFNSKLILNMGILGHKSNIETPVASKNKYEIFGFAPYWTINKLDNVDYNVLTTMAYFGVPLNADGTLDEDNIGYTTMSSDRAREVFAKARSHGTRVVIS